MAAFLSDTFTEASDTTLVSHTPDTGGTWVRIFTGSNTMSVVAATDKVKGDSTTVVPRYRNDASPPSADYYVQADIQVSTVSDNTQIPGIGLRCSGASLGDTITWYHVRYVGNATPASRAWQLRKDVGASNATLGSYAEDISTGTDYAVKLTVSGSNLEVFINGVSRITASDPDITAAGNVGITARSNGRVDNLVGDVAGATTTNVSLDAALTLTPAFVRQTGKTLAASMTLTPTLQALRVFLLALAATLSLTPALVKQVGKNVAAGVTATPAFTRAMGLALAATTIATAGTVLSVGKTLATTVTLTPAMTVSRVTLITLAATMSFTAGLLKMVGLNQAASTTLAAAMTLSATVAPVVEPVRPFTGFGGLGMTDGPTRWSLRKRTWKPRK